MPQPIDMTDQRFHSLTAIEPVGQHPTGKQIIWRFRCDCGKEIDWTGTAVRSGYKKHCGCQRWSTSYIDLTGKVYGRLTVLGRAGSKNGHPTWWVICECGAEKEVPGQRLREGSTRSCGAPGCRPSGPYWVDTAGYSAGRQ